jgi:hypothetical protein
MKDMGRCNLSNAFFRPVCLAVNEVVSPTVFAIYITLQLKNYKRDFKKADLKKYGRTRL